MRWYNYMVSVQLQLCNLGFERMTLTEQLRDATRATGQNIKTVSSGSGIDSAVLSRFLAGKHALSGRNMDKLAVYLQMELQCTSQSGNS